MVTDNKEFPTRAQAVIIGGGVIGCSVAYHLTKLGWSDVVVLEQSQLTAGATWHAAGLVTVACHGSETVLSMAKYTRDLYARLEEETEQDTGFRPVGYLQLAANKIRLEELRRTADFVRGFGVALEEISPAEVKRMWPLAETNDLIAGFYAPDDGRTNPVDTTMALAKGARMGGARIFQETRVIGIKTKNACVCGVVTDKGEMEADYVVNCCGMWAREVGKMAGVQVPLQAAEHYYLVTEPIEGMHPDLPIVEDLDRYAYYREESGGLMMGLFEPDAAPWGMDGIPEGFSFGELDPDWDRMIPHLDRAFDRIPAAREAGVRMLFCGPESFTPDKLFLMGEAPEVKNYFVAAGMNSEGVLVGGGVGRVMARWMTDGLPPVDVGPVNIDRLLPFQNSPRYLLDRTAEVLGLTYAEHWPNRQYRSARNIRRSPLHDRLAAAGACFAESAGWEYPYWFAPEGREARIEYSWGRQNWFEYNAAEHQAAREAVVLMDLSLMSKFLVQGPDAEKALNLICANNVSVPVGRIVYTQWLNSGGLIEADVTVVRLAENRYRVVGSDTCHGHVYKWLKKNIPAEARAEVVDVTSGLAIINVQGPLSRELLGGLTESDLSNSAFPYMAMQEIDLRYAPVQALRITYVGELGWELYIPTEFACYAYDILIEAGGPLGLKQAGLQTLSSLRMEKAYRDMGHDIDNTDTPLEAGLGFAVDFDKPGGFIGKEALLRQKENRPLKRRLVQFLIKYPDPLLYHGEMIYRDGLPVGYIRSGGYGHTLGGPVGLGYVENPEGVTREYIDSGNFEIEAAGERYPAKASLRPLYDPEKIRVKS